VGLQKKLEQKGFLHHPQLSWPKSIQLGQNIGRGRAQRITQNVIKRLKRPFQSQTVREQQAFAAKFLDPQTFNQEIETVLHSIAKKVDLVFNLFVDGYLQHSDVWKEIQFRNRDGTALIPWAGLCITPEALSQAYGDTRIPDYYSLESYRGTCFLDENVLQIYQYHFPAKTFTFLPDITETGLPKTQEALVTEMLGNAAGRKIVFMGGSIGKQKNLVQWIDLILNADPTQWYFVQVGRINHNNLLPDDQRALAKLETYSPENLYVHADYLPDEALFNAIIAASDVIFAVYRDFYRSSNMLSKAAYFEKPLLVADNCLMGDRVSKYGIGLALPFDQSDRIQAGLIAALGLENLSSKFAAYREDFSPDKFCKRLNEFARACLDDKSSLKHV
jgi:glycosyltransferase involved in cell wall biosynthesis